MLPHFSIFVVQPHVESFVVQGTFYILLAHILPHLESFVVQRCRRFVARHAHAPNTFVLWRASICQAICPDSFESLINWYKERAKTSTMWLGSIPSCYSAEGLGGAT